MRGSRSRREGRAGFRAIDILKPWPCGAAEKLPKGAGIVADDLVAGLGTTLAVSAVERVLRR